MPPSEPLIRRGLCHAMFAYDIGLAINLDQAARLTREATEPETLRRSRRTPAGLEFRPSPLRVIQSAPSMSIAGFSTAARVECVLYDFGAVSVTYGIPLSGPLAALLPLSDALYENRALLDDSRARVARLLTQIAPAVDRPEIADLVEDYAVYQVQELDGLDARTLIASHPHTLARILRSEPAELSDQEVDDALSSRLSYAPGESVLIDWNSALLFQADADDARAVLEFANVELLELRLLDDQLDTVLDRSYHALSHGRWSHGFRFTAGRGLRRIAQLQMDSALLFEGVNNALKLIGDQYLARLYRLAATRMHLPEWDASILRKLQTAESIYQKLSDQQSTRRMEAMELIIIALFLFEIVMTLLRK